LTGALIGMTVATAAFAGLYFSGAIPNKSAQVQSKGQPGPAANPQPGTPDGTAQLPPGRARLYSAVGSGDAAELQKAREELQTAADAPEGDRKAVEATIFIGVTHEVAGDRAAARKVYEEAIKKFPAHADAFRSALDRLDATEARPDGTSFRLDPAGAPQLLLAVILLQSDAPAKDEPEAGAYFWKAVKAATDGKYAEAVGLIDKAKAAHVKQAKTMAGRGVNPLSDPLEQIFPRACDDLKAYWQLREAVYTNKAVADLIKKEGPKQAMAELQKRADDGVRAVTELKNTTAKLTQNATDLKNATAKATQLEKDLTAQKAAVTKLEKEVKAERDALETADLKFIKAEDARKKGDELIAALAKELQAAKLLPEKFDAESLLAAQKSAATRATGPTLSALLPSGMVAVGGGGLSAGHLADVAERLTRAEAAAKAADTKLATETKKLRDEHAAEVKKLTDGYAAETKKLMDTYATGTTKLKEDHAGELKKMTDKFAADMKTLADTHATKVKTLEAAVTQEKERAEALAAKFKVDLGNAMSPAQALDVWLPLLTDLRRGGDAEPALATATKVMETAPADSEDAAKARTVAGMAHFVKGEMGKAKAMFEAARSSPAYRAAAGKAWARAADIGLQSITDPLAPYRRPVEVTQRDTRAAARHLDTGVKAYRAGRYTDATTALTESTKADPANPVAWYFLGAAKWGAGSPDRAKDDFLQGAEREKFSTLSTRVISDALTPIQGAARDALNAARP
jgi:tetratricopeptide (TPR) repeat protein